MDKRALILAATLKLILEEGFYFLSIAKVAKAAGVAPGTIYLYFTGKDQLIQELYGSVMQQYHAVLSAEAHSPGDLREQIQATMRHMLHFFLARPDCYSFLLQYSLSPFFRQDAQQHRAQLLAPIYELVETAQAQGLVRDLPPALLVTLISGPIFEMVRLWIDGLIDLLEPTIQQQLLAACWDSVRVLPA